MNALDGERVVRDLLENRDLWEAVLLYRLCGCGRGPDLIPLRDLPYNDWNVDTLYVLAKDRRGAERMASWADAWGSEQAQLLVDQEAERALGAPAEGRCILVYWWD